MKTKIIAVVVIAVFAAGIFSVTAGAIGNTKIEKQKSHKDHGIFKWIKLFFRVLKLEKTVSKLQVAVRKLNRDLDRETMERQSGDRRLKLIIDDEAETREEGDIALGEEIDREAAAREKGDERLANALKDESTARMEADEDLQEQIDAIETGAVKVPIFFTSGADIIQSTSSFGLMGIGHLKEGAGYWIITPMSGEISDLIGYSIEDQDLPENQSISFTLYVNEAPTALSCSLNQKDRCTNDKDAVPVKTGDKLAILVRPSSASIIDSEVGASVVLAGQ